MNVIRALPLLVAAALFSGCGDDMNMPESNTDSAQDAATNSTPAAVVAEVDIVLGDSTGPVIRALGPPKGKMKAGGNDIWLFDAGEVVFRHGKVTSVEFLTDEQFAANLAERKRLAAERRAAAEALARQKAAAAAAAAAAAKPKVVVFP